MSKKENEILNLEWWSSAIIYQIYPLSFKDTTDNGRGDLKGIIKNLDYLKGTNRSLDIDVIWMNPINPSPKKDHGYDVADYYDIDPELGDLETFDLLVKEANKRGIKIMMDYVLNHTSSQNPWFLESRSSKDNPKSNWYIWLDPKPDGSPPNNWLSVFGGSAWTFDENRKQYYMHSFLSDQPDLNWRNPEVVEEMKNVLLFWLNKGVSGFRADAIEHLYKDKEFRDEPQNPHHNPKTDNPYDALIHTYSRNQMDEITKTIKEFDDLLDGKEQNLMVNEVWAKPEDLSYLHNASEKKLCVPLNLNLIHTPWQANNFKKLIDNYDQLLGKDNWPNYVIGNHDVSRVIDRIGISKAKTAALLLLTLRGTPFIYYGDEIGMGNAYIPDELIQDPWKKQVPEIEIDRDVARTPMQWNTDPNAGFSISNPWLPVCHNYKEINVEKELEDPDSILNTYRSLIKIRRRSTALTKGKYCPLESGNENVLAYLREYENEKILIVINFSDEKEKVSLNIAEAETIFSTCKDRDLNTKKELEDLELKGNEGCIFKLK